jgi:hypothetical protein
VAAPIFRLASRRAPPSLPLQPPEPWAALLEALREIEDERTAPT